MKPVVHLTPDQAALLPTFRDKWIGIGLTAEPADRGLAEDGVQAAYRAAGLAPPRIVWCASPLAMAAVRAFVLTGLTGPADAPADRILAGLRAGADLLDWERFRAGLAAGIRQSVRHGSPPGPCVTDRVGTRPRDDARATVLRGVGSAVWERVGVDLGAPVRARIGAGVFSPVGRGVWNSVRASAAADLWGPFRDAVGMAIRAALYGQHDAHWLGVYDFFRAAGLGDCTRALAPLWTVAQAAGWWLPHENLCWISDRPRALALDESGALHSATGPALVYPDGWSLYAWRGTPVPRDWIERPDRLSPKTALTHPNVEQRRAACEILGWERVLSTLDARVIERDGDPEIGELVEVEIPEIGCERFLRVLCGTGRRFALPVPPHVATALEANAWTYGIDAETYKPEVRT